MSLPLESLTDGSPCVGSAAQQPCLVRPGSRRWFCALAASSLLCFVGCGPRREVIIEVKAKPASSKAIDADPWALLPPGAVLWSHVSASSLFASSFGEEAGVFLTDHLPLSRGLGFDPRKSIEQLHTAVYATAGTDFVCVARGRFDPRDIELEFAEAPTAPHGGAIVMSRFAGFDVYVSAGVALVPLTTQTLLFGTEIGLRRVLERIEMNRLVRTLPDWYEDMLEQPAEFSLGIDLDAQAVPATVRSRVSFLEGLRAGRLLGNFRDPGMNLAGTLSYDRAESATQAAETMEALVGRMEKYAILFEVLKIQQPLRRFETRAQGRDTQVVLEVEGRAIGMALVRGDEVVSSLKE